MCVQLKGEIIMKNENIQLSRSLLSNKICIYEEMKCRFKEEM